MAPDRVSRMKLGVTGGIAAGKTAVCDFLTELGARVIDADRIGHEILDGDLLRRVAEKLGDSFILPDGRPDRRELGRLVFSRPEALRQFNSIVHPPLLERLEKELTHSGAEGAIVVDAALLFEWGIESWFDKLLVVVAPDPVRLERLVGYSGLSLAEARGRLTNQMPQEEKARYADFVIENGGTLDELREKVEKLWPDIERLKTQS